MELSEFSEHCFQMNALKKEHKRLKELAAEVWEDFLEMKSEALTVLEDNKLQNYDTGVGKISIKTKRSVSILDKVEFWDHLKSKNIFEDLVTISSATATKFYDAEFEEAKENKDVAFLRDGIPGLSEPKKFTDIAMRGFK